MKIFDVPLSEAKKVAEELGIVFEGDDISNSNGDRIQGQLKPKPNEPNPYQRTSRSFFNPDRKVHAICWHGHRDFYRGIFRINPDARIQSGYYFKADWKGSEDFEDNYRDTGHIEIGAPIAGGYPRMCDACSCPESGYAE
jgi:hypothetical protein